MTSTCEDACIICDIDGFSGRNSSTELGVPPDGFCTLVLHNIQWLAFLAGSEDITLEVSVFECDEGQGLEVGIYESFDCETTQLVSNCNADIPENTTATFSNTTPLTIGQYYYFVMDGNYGDICNYTISVLDGSTQVSPLETSGSIVGDLGMCVTDGLITYSVEGVTGAVMYEWTINGISYGTGEVLSVDWNVPGFHELCVTASNACDIAPPICETIQFGGFTNNIVTEICEGECIDIANTSLCETGSYSFDLIASEGCDSTVNIELTVLPRSTVNIDVDICYGDTLFVNGNPFYETGFYQEVIEGVGQGGQGNICDSIVNLGLNTIDCELNIVPSIESIVCNGEMSGTISFAIQNGVPPFNYTWQILGTDLIGQGTWTTNDISDNTAIIEGLGAGYYHINIVDAVDDDVIVLIEMDELPSMILSETIGDFNGFGVSCIGESDGWIDIELAEDVSNYNIEWEDGSTQIDRSNLSAGIYSLMIEDMNNCQVNQSFVLESPTALNVDAAFIDLTCEGPQSGNIQIDANGGAMPYQYSIGNGFDDNPLFNGLELGEYTAYVKDANGCEQQMSGVLTSPQIPILDLGDDQKIQLGEMLQMNVQFNKDDVELFNIVWNDDLGLDCYKCLEPTAFPFETTTYSVDLESIDGCIRSDSVTIFVEEKRSVFIPNAFSPNADGVNDLFYINADLAVRNIQSFKVYSRWGDLVFYQRDFAPNDSKYGWDGTYNNEELAAVGVYIFYAQIEFIDGLVLPYKGNVTLVR